jgi:hypothetical protein
MQHEELNTPTGWFKDIRSKAKHMAAVAAIKRAGKKMVKVKNGTWVYINEGEAIKELPKRFIDTLAEEKEKRPESTTNKRRYSYKGEIYNLTELANVLGRNVSNLHSSLKSPMYRNKLEIVII